MDKEEIKKASILKRISKYSNGKLYLLYLSIIFSMVSGIFTILPMYYIWKIIYSAISSESVEFSAIKTNIYMALMFSLFAILLYFIALLLSHFIAFYIENNIMSMETEKLLNKPLGFFLNNESGKIRKIIVDGAGATHTFIAHQIPDFASTALTPVMMIILLLLFDLRLGIATLVPVLIGMFLMGTMMNKESMDRRKAYYDSLSRMSAESVEYVRGIPVVKTFAQSVESFKNFYKAIVDYKEIVVEMSLFWKNKMAFNDAIVGSVSFFVVPVAIILIGNNANLSKIIGDTIMYLLIGPSIGLLIMRSAYMMQDYEIISQSLDTIDDLMDYKDLSYGNKYSNGSDIEFKNVSFSYGDNKIIEDISFKVNKGQTFALVGASGGGKTTVARLSARFWDVDEGEIKIGDVNIREYSKKALMNKISFVFQNSSLFKMSIRDNLLIGKKDATDEELYEALRKSGAMEIIDRIGTGLDTIIGTKGTYLSGGETQRILIARAILKNSDIIILDEATAFADPESEHIIQESFKELSKDKTTLMIAHRLSSVINADKILVINDGKIIESGTHKELLEKNSIYKNMWEEYQNSITWTIKGGQHA